MGGAHGRFRPFRFGAREVIDLVGAAYAWKVEKEQMRVLADGASDGLPGNASCESYDVWNTGR